MPDLDAELRRRLKDREDQLVERKPKYNSFEFFKTVVAFANSVRSPATGVLFLGVNDDGSVNRSAQLNPQKTQDDCTHGLDWCYPIIPGVQLHALEIDGAHVVAVTVPESGAGPHFAGPAFVREGHRSTKASDSVFEQLVADRVSPARLLRPWIGTEVLVERQEQHPAGYTAPYWSERVVRMLLLGLDQYGLRLGVSGGADFCPVWQRVGVESRASGPPKLRISLSRP